MPLFGIGDAALRIPRITLEGVLLEQRYRCIADRHEGHTYNVGSDKTWCHCGYVVRPGDHGSYSSAYERAEADRDRRDEVGRSARSYLSAAHRISVN